MDASEAKRPRELKVENANLKRLVADKMLDMTSMMKLLGKKLVAPVAKRKAAGGSDPRDWPERTQGPSDRRSVAICAAIPPAAQRERGSHQAHEKAGDLEPALRIPAPARHVTARRPCR